MNLQKLPKPLPRLLEPVECRVDEEAVSRYAALTFDYNPIHFDKAFVAATPFGVPIVHGTVGLGLLLLSLERSFGGAIPRGAFDARFVRPVPVGATMIAGGVLVDESAGLYDVYVETEERVRAIEATFTVEGAEGVPATAGPSSQGGSGSPDDRGGDDGRG